MGQLGPGPAVVRSTGRSPLPAADLIRHIVDASLPQQFRDWLALHGVADVEGQIGAWRTAGQQRVLRMTDGSEVAERLVDFDRRLGWTNELSGFTNEVRFVLARLDDDWRFTEDADGTLVTWTWTFHPRRTVAGRALTHAVVAPLHRPYLQRILDGNLARAAADLAPSTR